MGSKKRGGERVSTRERSDWKVRALTDSVPWMFDNLHFVESNLGRPKHAGRSARLNWEERERVDERSIPWSAPLFIVLSNLFEG